MGIANLTIYHSGRHQNEIQGEAIFGKDVPVVCRPD